MTRFHSPDNYWGTMRIDGDVGRKPTYVRLTTRSELTRTHIQFPNSYQSTNPASAAPTFAGESVAEAPYQAASNVVSRRSHWSHEGETSEYDQVRELYTRVMTQTQRDHLHNNTAKLLAVSLSSVSVHVSLTNSLPIRSFNKDTSLSSMLLPQHMLRRFTMLYQPTRGESTPWPRSQRMPRLLISRERT
jgi:hypothetical protein